MLASVLHMSNLRFDKVDNEQGDIASISDREVFAVQLQRSSHELLALQYNILALWRETPSTAHGQPACLSLAALAPWREIDLTLSISRRCAEFLLERINTIIKGALAVLNATLEEPQVI